jgi:hypothetical protein
MLHLLPRQLILKLIPSKMRDVLILVRYTYNTQNATFFEALASYSVTGVTEGNAETDGGGNNSSLDD